MLVLSRLRGESVMIGNDIAVTVIDSRGDKVRLGITAPRNVAVHRKEVFDAIQQQNKSSTGLQPGDLPAAARPPQRTLGDAPAPIHLTRFFTPWQDPASGLTSYILTNPIAPIQQSLPASPSLTSDGRYLWFACAFPPAGDAKYGRTLAVVDFEQDEIRHFPETQFADESPRVIDNIPDIHWSTPEGHFRRSPLPSEMPVSIPPLPAPAPRPIEHIIIAAGFRLLFQNRHTDKEILIVSKFPLAPAAARRYNPSPNPQLAMNNQYLVYTTTVLDRVDVALIPVASLIEATK